MLLGERIKLFTKQFFGNVDGGIVAVIFFVKLQQ